MNENDFSEVVSDIKYEKLKPVSEKDNRYYKIIHLARAFDSWRPFPRLFIGIYIYILYSTVQWYMNLTQPTVEQSGFVSVIIGVGAAWFSIYINGTPRGDKS